MTLVKHRFLTEAGSEKANHTGETPLFSAAQLPDWNHHCSIKTNTGCLQQSIATCIKLVADTQGYSDYIQTTD